jgi:hypothetical protein
MRDVRDLRVPLVRDWLRSGESVWLHLRGDCMHPTLPAGCRILVAGAVPDGMRSGDVIVYLSGGSVACHRVIWRRGRGAHARFLARADARKARDEWVAGARVLGRVVGLDRHGRISRLDTRRARAAALTTAAVSLARSGAAAACRRMLRMARRPRLVS